MWWGRGGGRKLKSNSASIEHIVEGWGGLGHEQSGLKVLVSRGHESRVGVHTRLVRFSVEMYGAWRSGSAWTERVPRRDMKDKRGRSASICVLIGVRGRGGGTPLRLDWMWPPWDSVLKVRALFESYFRYESLFWPVFLLYRRCGRVPVRPLAAADPRSVL